MKQHLDEWADVQKEVDGATGCLAALSDLKQEYTHLKTLVSVGGGTASAEFPVLAADETARWTFARAIRQFCDTHNLDGVDSKCCKSWSWLNVSDNEPVDWEHPKNSEEGEDFIKLLECIREECRDRPFLLTAALPAHQFCLKNIDLIKASQALDFMNLMAYDYTGDWTEVAGHHAQLHAGATDKPLYHPALSACGASGIYYALSNGFPNRKVLLGVPVYARHFTDAEQPGNKYSCAKDVDYCEMPSHWIGAADIDESAVAASFVDSEGGLGFLSFDVPYTVKAKAQFVRANSLGGLFYWAGTGDKEGDLSLVAAGYAKLIAP